jgi:hypothetical protein
LPLVFESSRYVAELARLDIKRWAGGAGRVARGGRVRRGIPMPVPASAAQPAHV